MTLKPVDDIAVIDLPRAWRNLPLTACAICGSRTSPRIAIALGPVDRYKPGTVGELWSYRYVCRAMRACDQRYYAANPIDLSTIDDPYNPFVEH